MRDSALKTPGPESSDVWLPKFEKLCAWIEGHLDEQIGWRELMQVSDLDFQTINLLFYKYKSTTPMTWIRRKRLAHSED